MALPDYTHDEEVDADQTVQTLPKVIDDRLTRILATLTWRIATLKYQTFAMEGMCNIFFEPWKHS